MEIQEAIERPALRRRARQSGRRVADLVRIESRVPAATREALAGWAQRHARVRLVHCAWVTPTASRCRRTASLRGGADPRGDGAGDRLLTAAPVIARASWRLAVAALPCGPAARPRTGVASSPASPRSSRCASATARRRRRPREGRGLRHHPVGLRGRARRAGILRMIVDFGMLTPQGYKPTVVRASPARAQAEHLRQEHRRARLGPARRHRQPRTSRTRSSTSPASSVIFTKDGTDTVLMTFTPPEARRTRPGSSGPPPRP